MSWKRQIAKLRTLFARRKPADDLEEEIRAHLAMEEQENLEAGLPPEEAHFAALRRFGNVALTEERSRDMWGWRSAGTILQDLRYGLRQMRRSPGFTAVAALTLALGIGADTTIFSVVWRPMRYYDADRLAMVWETRPDGARSPVSVPTYLDWRDHNTCFEQLAATRSESVALSGNPPTLVSENSVTPNFFDTFRLRVDRGRFFSAAEFRPGSPKVAILSHEMWQARFGGDPGIVGKPIRLNGEPYVVVGVAPRDFEFFGTTDVWVPLAIFGAEHDRETRDLLVVGRTKAGVTAAEAQGQMRALADRIAQESPETHRRWSALVQNFRQALAGPGVTLMLALLLASVSVVLLMACANVANLLLARATTRQKEIGVRVALGASRWRVIRQLLVETLLLALLGGGLGLLLAWAAVSYLATLAVLQAPGLAPIEINQVVLEFASALCLAAAALSGLVPAWRITSANLLEHVKASGRTAMGERTQSRLRNGLVIGGLALSLMLMVTAGLSLRSFIRLTRVDPGFPSKGLLTAYLSLPAPQYAGGDRVRGFYSELLNRVSAIPNVESVAISSGLPPTPIEAGPAFRVEGADPSLPDSSGAAIYQVISPGYFRTLGLTLRQGRAFAGYDGATSVPVVIVNQRLAEKFFPGSDPLGKRLLIPELVPHGDEPSHAMAAEIVGVVNNVKNIRLSEPSSPEIYLSYLQAPRSSAYLVVRSHSETEPLMAALRRALAAVDPDLPFTRVSTMNDRLSNSLAGGRIVVTLMTVFALIALSMGSVGLYGVISYTATQRTGEFAVRMALGAQRREIFSLVANDALRLLALGGAAGMVLAVGAARLLSGLIFGISPYDPVTFATVGLVVLLVVLIASYVPARRATKVDPMVALRYE